MGPQIAPPPLPKVTQPAIPRTLADADANLAAHIQELRHLKSQLRSAGRQLFNRRIRLRAARTLVPNWIMAMSAGSVGAIAVALILIVFGAGLAIVVSLATLAYLAAGAFILYYFRPLHGENESNRLDVRTEEVKRATLYQADMIGVIREKSALVAEARQLRNSIAEMLRSEVYKRQVETKRLLNIEAGRLYPDEFERHVADIFKHLGFTAEVVGQSGDQGVDVLACRDQLRIAIQAKRYQDSVGNNAIQQVFAGMVHHKCHRCVVVATSTFTPSAIALAQSTGCLLIGSDRIPSLIRGEIAFQ